MGWWKYILPLYMLVLAVMPCTDQLTVPIPNNFTQLEQDLSNHDHAEDDTCTPLCGCACCGAHISEVAFFWYESPEQPLVYQLTNSFFGKYPLVSDFKGSIWQPPRVIA
ncbi:DUF6660 family protein [Sphingobacterium paucimobilis]|uniref:Uncharacterized protein n=1 Tax=Sphingobacterium paucimobilis HER1398 TaxID=1346330 RepID=U2HB08_9SPHI|nr:DUF6660 family protein [Sphingobacterium paucimobilis]ERJ58931.1 hypothetical protein M472_09120 [Sphingobacterium paucimobilis HER1398]